MIIEKSGENFLVLNDIIFLKTFFYKFDQNRPLIIKVYQRNNSFSYKKILVSKHEVSRKCTSVVLRHLFDQEFEFRGWRRIGFFAVTCLANFGSCLKSERSDWSARFPFARCGASCAPAPQNSSTRGRYSNADSPLYS